MSDLLEVYHLDYRHGVVVGRRAVAARVGHIHIVVDDLHLFGLIAHAYLACGAERQSVYIVDGAFGGVGVDEYRPYI